MTHHMGDYEHYLSDVWNKGYKKDPQIYIN